MKCCGKDVETPYCPMCGEESNIPGQDLLNYLKTRQKNCQRLIDVWANAEKTDEDLEELHACKQYRTQSENIAKWKKWAELVAAAIRDGWGAER